MGIRIFLDSVFDLDVGENFFYIYFFFVNDFFNIEVRIRIDGVKYVEFIVVRELDRELKLSYEF